VAQHAFWIIVDGQTPSSFRSRQREDLLPTLNQLKRTQPQVALMWFERGRLWPSPDEARAALIIRRKAPTGRPREWRPGGDHKDPRAKYAISRDQKRARFKTRMVHDWREAGKPADSGSKPPDSGDKPADSGGQRPDRPPFRPSHGDRPKGDRPRGDRPFGDRPHGDRAPSARFRKPGPPRNREGGSETPPPPRESSGKPKAFGDRPWRPKKAWQPGKPWRPGKPKGGK
jgi:hypothetical protein